MKFEIWQRHYSMRFLSEKKNLSIEKEFMNYIYTAQVNFKIPQKNHSIVFIFFSFYSFIRLITTLHEFTCVQVINTHTLVKRKKKKYANRNRNRYTITADYYIKSNTQNRRENEKPKFPMMMNEFLQCGNVGMLKAISMNDS